MYNLPTKWVYACVDKENEAGSQEKRDGGNQGMRKRENTSGFKS
jgi:hypothetical protein